MLSTSASIEISGFTGGSSNANGMYFGVGYLNGKVLYRHGLSGDFYYFYNGSTWALTDTPVTISGGACYVNGGADVNGKLDNSSGSNGNCFDGQTASVMMINGPRFAEDEESLMSTEDKVNVLITEENL